MDEGQRCRYPWPDGFKRDETGKVMANEEVRLMQLKKRELDCAEAESQALSDLAEIISFDDLDIELMRDLRACGEAWGEEEENARRCERHERRLRERVIARQAERQRDQLG